MIKSLENEQQEKKNILGGMDRLLKEMLRCKLRFLIRIATKTSVGTQVEDGELFWKP